MDILVLHALLEFTKPYYAEKSEMHGLGHVQRVLTCARQLASGASVDDDLLVFGAYFHSIIFADESAIRSLLAAQGFDRVRVTRIMLAAIEAGSHSDPESLEGCCLHDAHLIEGGKEFQVAKAFVAGASRGQTLTQICETIEQRVIDRFKCSTEEGKRVYEEIEEYRRAFILRVRKGLEYEPVETLVGGA